VAATSCNPDSIPLPKAKGPAGAPACRRQGAARLRRFRLRELPKANIEGLTAAAGQNLKRLLSHQGTSRWADPCFAAVLFRSLWRSLLVPSEFDSPPKAPPIPTRRRSSTARPFARRISR